MSFKTIAVHLDDRERCATRVALAARLASLFEGRLVGIAPTGVPDVVVTMNSAVPDGLELVALSATRLRQKAEATARAFDAQCKALRIPAQSRVVVQEAVDALCEHGRCSDLIVVGQTDRANTPDGLSFDFPQQVLLHAGPPLLVVPYAGEFASIGRNVLVAWKGTREAANAVRSALPVLRRAREVSLIEIGAPHDVSAENDSLTLASTWLHSHGVSCVAQREAATGENAGKLLLSRAAEIGADLIVCGGYGHSRLREWVLGGVTHDLLERMTVPVLFSH